jgi:PLP dependent protein
MNTIKKNLTEIRSELPSQVRLVAVSKNHPVEAILVAYQAGQRLFGENRVQEILSKQPGLPADVEWHMIGHLQTNKVKLIAPFISMIHSVDSLRLLTEISFQASKNERVIDCLLQIFIATEETKFGMDREELNDLLRFVNQNPLPGVRIRGLMGMASFSNNLNLVRREFRVLKELFNEVKEESFANNPHFDELSIGMSGDYQIAIEEGSTLVRIGTRIFGTR